MNFKPILLLAFVVFYLQGFAQSNHPFDYYEVLNDAASTKTEKAKACNSMALYYVGVQPDSARYYVQQAMKHNNELSRELGDSYTAYGYYYDRMSLADSAIFCFNKALQSYTAVSHLPGVGNCYTNMGKMYVLKEDYADALTVLLKADSLFSRIGFKPGIVKVNLHLGILYSNIGELDKSIALYKKGLEVAEAIHDNPSIVTIKSNLGIVYAKQNKFDKAAANFSKTGNENDAQPVKNKGTIELADAFNKVSIAKLAMLSGNVKGAVKTFEEMKHYYSEINDLPSLAVCYADIGTCYAQLKESEKAKDAFLKCIDLCKKTGNNLLLSDAYDKITKLNIRSQNMDSVLKYYDSALQAKTFVSKKNSMDEIEKIQAQYDVKAKQLTIEKLQKEGDYKNSIQRLMTVSLIVLGMLTIFIFFTLFIIKKKNKELTEKKEDLQKLNMVKDQFFSTMSHDLRMPFNNVLSFIQLLQLEYGQMPDDYKIMVKKLEYGTTSALETMDNLLNWGKVLMNNTASKKEETLLPQMFERLQRLFEPIAEQHGAKLHFSSAKGLTLLADQNQLEVILRNLIGNAIKHSNNKGNPRVTATAINNSGKKIIKVNENSFANNLEQLKLLLSLENDVKLDNSLVNNGLGLVLVRQFVQLNDGAISVESDEDNGTTFTLVF